MQKKNFIIGAGGHGAVVYEALRANGETVEAFLDLDPALHGTDFMDCPVLSQNDALSDLQPAETAIANGVGDIGVRKKIFENLKQADFEIRTLIHPSAVVAPDVVIGEGAQIMAGSVVQPRTVIGDNVVLNTRCSIDHDCHLMAHSFIAPGAVLCDDVKVGDETLIGAGASVIEKIEIGRNVLIGAGAAVVGPIPDNTTALGVPARLVK